MRSHRLIRSPMRSHLQMVSRNAVNDLLIQLSCENAFEVGFCNDNVAIASAKAQPSSDRLHDPVTISGDGQ